MQKIICLLLLLPLTVLGQNKKKKDYLVTVTTDFGIMHLVLYDQTPKHKENFIKLVDSSFYDGLLFHRVMPNFMIQGGDPNSKNAQPGQPLGGGGKNYRVPAEFVPSLFHKKGALAAARDGNPEKASSSCQFYIVQGQVWDEAGFAQQQERIKSLNGHLPTDEQTRVYKTLGGSPHLDGNYTVFGEVIDGIAVVDSIMKQPRDNRNRPNTDVRMTVKGDWVKKKKITKQFGYTFLK